MRRIPAITASLVALAAVSGCGGQTAAPEPTAYRDAIPPGWQLASDLPLAGLPMPEGSQQRGTHFVGHEVFVAATYDPATPAPRDSCKGGGPILDAMPPGAASVEVIEGHGSPTNYPPPPDDFTYANASRVLHECGGLSFEFGPFESSKGAFLARIWMHTTRDTGPSRTKAASQLTRKQALEVLGALQFGKL